jgi:hypothetical protein
MQQKWERRFKRACMHVEVDPTHNHRTQHQEWWALIKDRGDKREQVEFRDRQSNVVKARPLTAMHPSLYEHDSTYISNVHDRNHGIMGQATVMLTCTAASKQAMKPSQSRGTFPAMHPRGVSQSRHHAMPWKPCMQAQSASCQEPNMVGRRGTNRQRDEISMSYRASHTMHACHFHILHGFMPPLLIPCSLYGSIYTQSQRKSNTNAALVCPMSCLDSKYFRVLEKYHNFENHVKNWKL